MLRIAALACLLLAVLAPAAAAAGRAGTARALGAQMRWAGAVVGRDGRRPRLRPHDLLAAGGHAADAGVGAEALHVGRGAAPARPDRPPGDRRAGRGGARRRRRRRRRPLPARQRRPDVRRARLRPARPAGRRRRDRRGARPRARRRVGVRPAPRRAVLRLPAHVRGRPAVGADVQPRPLRAARAVLAAQAGALRRGGVRQAAARRSACACAARAATGRAPADARARDRVALAVGRRPRAADEPAVGQLHGRDVRQGARLAVRRLREHGRRDRGRDARRSPTSRSRRR